MRRTLRNTATAALAAALAGVLVGCSSSGSPSTVTGSVSGSIDVDVAGARHVRPDHTVVVSASPGTALDTVLIRTSHGHRLHGRFSANHTRWHSTQPLEPATSYNISASAANGGLTLASGFRTLTPRVMYGARVAPLAGETVGVGMPLAVYFTAAVTDRAATEARFHVTTSPAIKGAWHWYSDTEMHYRPKHFWPSGTDVTLTYDLRALPAAGNAWSDDARSIPFHIGPSHVSKVDANTHEMRVYEDGKLIKTYPVSTGRDTLPTSSGIHVVSEKNADQLMDSSTIGIPVNSPDGYYEHVPWSVRISNSGEFVHAAPWSVADQGHRNVSHGCVNMAPDAAKWFFNYSRRGDIVEVTGTSRTLEQGNGFADWNMSWSDWVAGDALS